MGRIRLGFRLAGQSWRIVRTERSLLAFPVLAALFGLLYLAVVVAPLGMHCQPVVQPFCVADCGCQLPLVQKDGSGWSGG